MNKEKKEVFVFEVSQQSFGSSVLLNSHKLPVLVEFMGVWSEPSVLMADLFAILAKEFAGEFIFAKVDIDEQAELKEEYEIKNIPTLMVFQDGKMVRKEVGQLQEVEARSLLKDFGVFRASDLSCEQARDMHLAGDTQGAILLLTQAIKDDPTNTRIAMNMVQIFIDINQIEQATSLFTRLPEADRKTEMGKALNGQLTFANLAADKPPLDTLQQQLTENPNHYSAHFDIAIHLVSLYEYEQAMNHLFFIIENDIDYQDGAAKEMFITITNMIAPVNNDLAQQFRRKLANLLAN